MRKAVHSLIKEVGLGRVAKMTAWKKVTEFRTEAGSGLKT
jgi:hypothetical protein